MHVKVNVKGQTAGYKTSEWVSEWVTFERINSVCMCVCFHTLLGVKNVHVLWHMKSLPPNGEQVQFNLPQHCDDNGGQMSWDYQRRWSIKISENKTETSQPSETSVTSTALKKICIAAGNRISSFVLRVFLLLHSTEAWERSVLYYD